MPLFYSPTGEPYITLPSPHDNIILTPPRTIPNPNGIDAEPLIPEADLSAITTNLNDPRIYLFLEGPPVPYTRDDGIAFTRMIAAEATRILQAAQAEKFVEGCPFHDIRILPDEGEDRIQRAEKIGDISFSRKAFFEIPPDSPERAAAEKENEERKAGDEEIKWTMGYWLTPAHHGKGIMAAALSTLIREWVVPRMNAKVIIGSAFAENRASVQVMRKCGFIHDEKVIEKGSRELIEARGGGRKDIVVIKWRRND